MWAGRQPGEDLGSAEPEGLVVEVAVLGPDTGHVGVVDSRFASQHRQIGIFVDGNNIGDTRYTEAASAPMPGRWFNLGINFGM
jgi:hypothetical protein